MSVGMLPERATEREKPTLNAGSITPPLRIQDSIQRKREGSQMKCDHWLHIAVCAFPAILHCIPLNQSQE